MGKLKMDQESIEWILNQLEGIQFGTVLITVHDGKIVQIERTEKSRKVTPESAGHHRNGHVNNN